MVVLHKMLPDAHFCHRLFVVTLQEKAAGVTEHPGLENKHAGQRGFGDLQGGNDC